MYSLSLSLSLSPQTQKPNPSHHWSPPNLPRESLSISLFLSVCLSLLFCSAFIFQCHQLFFNAQQLFETKTKSTCFYFSPLLLIENLFKGDYDTIQFNGYCSVALFIWYVWMKPILGGWNFGMLSTTSLEIWSP